MDLPPLPPNGPEHACHLFYRPLREGSGEGPPAPWTVETFDDSDGATKQGPTWQTRCGPALDALSELARGGGRWLAFVKWTGAADGLPGGSVRGEYVVRDGSAEPLTTWHARWPIHWWERPVISGVDMLTVPDVPIRLRWRAAFALARVTQECAPLRGSDMKRRVVEMAERTAVEGGYTEAILTAPDCDVRQAQGAFSGYLDEMADLHAAVRRGGNDRLVPGGAFDLRLHMARVSEWDEASAAVIRRVVGDAWFITRATPTADQ